MSWLTENSRSLYRRAINWSQFANEAANIDEYTVGPVAKEVKYTEVKEGQQYPVGKHGQLKLFHEHVWPKGYTPERSEEIDKVARGFVDVNLSKFSNDVRRDPEMMGDVKRGKHRILESLKRSTIGAGTLGILKDLGGHITLDPSVGLHDNVTGYYDPRSNRAVVGFRDTDYSTLHELGHLHDMNADTTGWDLPAFAHVNTMKANLPKYAGETSFPILEGRAEGFAMGHQRVTRSMRRNAMVRGSGYFAHLWEGPIAKAHFRNNRLKAFRVAQGLDAYPERFPEAPKPPEPYIQTKLPGFD